MEAHAQTVREHQHAWSGESELVARLRVGEEEAFAALVKLHGGRLLATARRLLRDESEAEDAVQKTFLSAFQAVDGFSGNSQLSTWLHSIVVNHALMKLRSERRHPEQRFDELLPQFDEDGHRSGPVRDWDASCESKLSQHETRLAVRRAIDRLPPGYRSVILLRDIEEWDTNETAEAMGITAAAVKIRLHRARQALRTLLEPTFADA